MAEYKIYFKRSAVKDLDAIPTKDLQRIINRIDLLKEDPRPPGCEKLSGQERYRVRQQNYRIVYWVFQTGCFTPGSTHNDWGTSRPCLFPSLAVKSKPPALRVVVDPIQDDVLTVWVVKIGHRRDAYR